MLRDLTNPSPSAFYAISPNHAVPALKICKPDIYFYNLPDKSLSAMIYENFKEALYIKDPRSNPNFFEGIDNLSPITKLKGIVFVPLCSQGQPLGLMQLINKCRGEVTDEDASSCQDIGVLVGNYISVVLNNIKLGESLEEIVNSYKGVQQQLTTINEDLRF